VKNVPVFALPEVERDLRAAMLHYSSWRSDGAEHIRVKYDETVAGIGRNPDAFPKKHGDVRRALLKRSYYVVYFVEEPDRSVVVAVLDARRDPQEIRDIVEERKKGPKPTA
jgi:plasmid stabilization system protein ParE